MSTRVKDLSDATFDSEAMASAVPVIVDFWAPWCVPCRMVSPIVGEIADDYGDKIMVGKVNVDEHVRVASRYNITGIPTLLFIKNGQVVDQIIGAAPKARIVSTLEKHM